MNSDRVRRRLALVLLVLISAVAMIIMSSQSSDANSGVPGQSGAVAQIGSETVTAADLNAQVSIVQSNLSYMQGEIAGGNPSSAYLQAFSNLIQAHGIKNVAFAGLIDDQALYQLAIGRGFNPSDAAVSTKVEQDKALEATSNDASFAAYVATVGEQRFWSTLYPAAVRRSLATQALFQSVTAGKTTSAAQASAWLQVQQQAISATPVRVVSAAALAPASLDAAMAYLADYWQFTAQ